MDNADDSVNVSERFKVPQWLIDAKTNAINDCRMLYCGTKKPPTESLMCFGWECGDGWNDRIAELSYRLEALNLLLYPKYRTRIEAVQIKEKFGYFRGYFDVVIDPNAIIGFPLKILNRINDFLSNKVDYGYETTVIEQSHYKEDWEEISKEDFEKRKILEYVANEFGWKFEERDGKYYRNRSIYCPAKWQRNPTRHQFLHWLKEKMQKTTYLVRSMMPTRHKEAQEVMAAFMDSYMERCVRETERECHNTCEYCGMQIGDGCYDRCETRGWIQYICPKCAKERNLEYINQKGELCNPDGSIKMSKEEFDELQRERYKVKSEPGCDEKACEGDKNE